MIRRHLRLVGARSVAMTAQEVDGSDDGIASGFEARRGGTRGAACGDSRRGVFGLEARRVGIRGAACGDSRRGVWGFEACSDSRRGVWGFEAWRGRIRGAAWGDSRRGVWGFEARRVGIRGAACGDSRRGVWGFEARRVGIPAEPTSHPGSPWRLVGATPVAMASLEVGGSDGDDASRDVFDGSRRKRWRCRVGTRGAARGISAGLDGHQGSP
jgi:hypothetical protein